MMFCYISFHSTFYTAFVWLGDLEERGVIAWHQQMKLETEEEGETTSTYDFPVGMGLVRR
jgi:hypothetical protein